MKGNTVKQADHLMADAARAALWRLFLPILDLVTIR